MKSEAEAATRGHQRGNGAQELQHSEPEHTPAPRQIWRPQLRTHDTPRTTRTRNTISQFADNMAMVALLAVDVRRGTPLRHYRGTMSHFRCNLVLSSASWLVFDLANAIIPLV